MIGKQEGRQPNKHTYNQPTRGRQTQTDSYEARLLEKRTTSTMIRTKGEREIKAHLEGLGEVLPGGERDE